MKTTAYYINYLFRNLTLLNLILAAVMMILSAAVILPTYRTSGLYSPPSVNKSAISDKEHPSEATVPSPSDFLIIADNNLFHPDRKIPPEKKTEEEKLLPKPDLVLYGTLITGNTSIAYLEDLKDPRNTPGRGKRQIALKKGDLLSGFTLTEIHPDEVVLTRGKETMTVAVSASHKKTKSGLLTQVPPPSPSANIPQPAKQPNRIERRVPRSQFESTIFNFLEKGKKR
jgi:hypothetical protein